MVDEVAEAEARRKKKEVKKEKKQKREEKTERETVRVCLSGRRRRGLGATIFSSFNYFATVVHYFVVPPPRLFAWLGGNASCRETVANTWDHSAQYVPPPP